MEWTKQYGIEWLYITDKLSIGLWKYDMWKVCIYVPSQYEDIIWLFECANKEQAMAKAEIIANTIKY